MTETVKGAASFAKNIAVLQAVADRNEPVSVADLVKAVSMPRPTVYRFIAALEAENFVEQTSSNKWQLGPRVINLASKLWRNHDIRLLAQPFLHDLRDITGETVHLAIRNGYEMTYIDKVESLETVRMTSTIGARAPFHSTSVGKAFILASSATDRNNIISNIDFPAITEHSITSKQVLIEQLSDFKSDGYVMEREENEEGVVCFGCAIINSSDNPVAAISISIPIFRLQSDHQKYTAPLIKACADVSDRLPPFL